MAHRISSLLAAGVVTAISFSMASINSPASPQVVPAAQAADPLSNFTFLTGTWRGEMNGEIVEEIWSAPAGGAMMGMFRWLNADGAPRMYELLTIHQQGDETLLRLRHFNAAMIAWEEKDAPIVMRLSDSSAENPRRVFTNVADAGRLERITFSQPKRDELLIDVEFRAASETPPLNFRFAKSP